MELVLSFKSPPFSINKAYYRRGNRTAEYRDWTQAIHDSLDSQEKKIREFSNSFDELKHCLEFRVTHFIPSDKLYTKAGKISRRSMDLSNIEKTLIDTLFDPKYFKRGFSTLNLDDTFIINLLSFKRLSPCDSYNIDVTIKILPLEESRGE